MTALILRGDARALPLPDASVDLIVTSPPYWALRSYTDGGQHYDGQIGSESTPREWVDALIDCTREWMRVLKPSGSIFVNLGDKYAERGGPARDAGADGDLVSYRAERPRRRGESETGIRQKSLMGLPWRYAIRCIDDLGLILRSEIVWSKPNGLPESVTDRVRRAHEQWFHFTLHPRYFAAVDEIRDAPSDYVRRPGAARATPPGIQRRGMSDSCNPLGRLPGSVWEIASEPLTVPDGLGVEHFAAFPTEWPRRLIEGWSPSGICSRCGSGRIPVSTRTAGTADAFRPVYGAGRHGKSRSTLGPRGASTTITGYACSCAVADAPSQPAVVLDPFGGTGTVALVASALGRIGISNDMSADYCRIAQWRTSDPAQRAKVLRLPKPPVERVGQLAFEFDGAA